MNGLILNNSIYNKSIFGPQISRFSYIVGDTTIAYFEVGDPEQEEWIVASGNVTLFEWTPTLGGGNVRVVTRVYGEADLQLHLYRGGAYDSVLENTLSESFVIYSHDIAVTRNEKIGVVLHNTNGSSGKFYLPHYGKINTGNT